MKQITKSNLHKMYNHPGKLPRKLKKQLKRIIRGWGIAQHIMYDRKAPAVVSKLSDATTEFLLSHFLSEKDTGFGVDHIASKSKLTHLVVWGKDRSTVIPPPILYLCSLPPFIFIAVFASQLFFIFAMLLLLCKHYVVTGVVSGEYLLPIT